MECSSTTLAAELDAVSRGVDMSRKERKKLTVHIQDMDIHGVVLGITDSTALEVLDLVGAEVDAECDRVVLNLLMELTIRNDLFISTAFRDRRWGLTT